MQSFATSHTAELYAIMDVIEPSAQISNNLVTRYTDSETAAAIIKYNNSHSMMKEILRITYNAHKYFSFCWVLSHTNVPGNELADEAAEDTINNVVAGRTIP